MSTFFLADRIKELSRTETAGPIVLDGAAPGFSSFDDFFASGDVVFYAITDNVDYEVGSGIYEPNGGDRTISRFPFRSSKLNSGPYYVNGDEANGPAGYYYPLYLTRSAAQSGVGFSDGPYTDVGELTFTEFPGITFYRPSEHQGYSPTVGISGSNYNSLSTPVDFDPGVKEVFVTYPGKSAVFNGYGLDSTTKEPKNSGIAFWRNESILNYSNQLVWDDTNNFLGIAQANPEYALDIGGVPSFSIVRASGFIEGGSGIQFSGGAITYTGATASGGIQYEPFLRNENGSGSQGLIEFSGIVNQYIGIAKQTPGTVFAGPEVDYCGPGPCPPDYPSFRLLTIDDIPLAELTSSGGFVIQENLGLDSQTANISPNNFALGMVAIYAGSGGITYDSGILFDYNNNRLLVGGDASVDTPAYNLDARGTIGSQSGYFNQLLFTDGLIRIGANAGTDDGNLTENFHIIGVGNNAGGGSTSGVFDGVLLGRLAGLSSETSSGVVLIGLAAGRNIKDSDSVVGIGFASLQDASAIISGVIAGDQAGSGLFTATNTVVIGTQAAVDGSGFTNTVLVGPKVGNLASGLVNVVALGNQAANQVDDLSSAIAIGLQAGNNATSGTDLVLIGKNAGENSVNLTNVVAVGNNVAQAASGQNNTYIGGEAGHGASGDGNIELTTNSTALAGTTSDKINLGGVIQGDLASNKLSLGAPSGLDPIATVVVEPATADDSAFLIRLQGSGSASFPFQVQSGDATALYDIDNSGNVRHNGWAQPSGGLWLPEADPTRNSGVGGYMLWNNGNTLIWNGMPISGENSFTQWQFLTEDGGGTITQNQQVTISGISGIQVIGSGAGNRIWTVDGGTLSGLIVELSGQIVASNYSFYTVASGVEFGNNNPKLMETNSYLVMSGVNGIEIDFIDQTDGTNSSGIFEITYNPSAAYTFNVTNGFQADTEILDGETVVVSGISGVEVQFEDQPNGSGLFTVSASGLSGVLQDQIDANLSYLSNEHGPISVSGVSGIAAYASGQVDNITQGGATSGLIQQNNNYIMDPNGSGNLSQLNFPNGQVRIVGEANEPQIYRGNSVKSTFIGSGVGASAVGDQARLMTAIGAGAYENKRAANNRDGMVIIGYNAANYVSPYSTTYSIAIGTNSLYDASGSYNVAIGYNAGFQNNTLNTRHGQYTVDIGYGAGSFQDATWDAGVNIGFFAGRLQASGSRNISIGENAGAGDVSVTNLNINNRDTISMGRIAGYALKDTLRGVIIGDGAGYRASGHNEPIFIGTNAGYASSGSVVGDDQGNAIGIGDRSLFSAMDIEQTIAIGDNAGADASGVEHSVFIGRWAGYKRSSQNSIIISNRSTIPPEGYDAGWCLHSQDNVLDIGHAIQGTMDTCNIHLGAELNDSYRTYSDINVATFSITPDSQTDSALVLWQYSTNGSFSTQAAGLMKTQTKNIFTIQPTLNEIINQDGFLRLPRATGVTGTYPNKILLADGQGVFAGPGVMAVYEFSPTDRGLAVSLNDGGSYAWYKIPITTIL